MSGVGKTSAPRNKDALYVGVDLGTSRTSIAASNGARETVSSFVGYPKDAVSRKLLQDKTLYGDAALAKRLSLNLFRPIGTVKFSDKSLEGDEAEQFMKAAKDLFEHAISLAKPNKDQVIYAVVGAPAQASIHNKKALVRIAKEVVDSVMICSEPFAVAYGLDMLDDTLAIDIGAGTVDLCRMRGTVPEKDDQITLLTAGDYLDQELYNALKEKIPQASFTINMVKSIKEKHAFVTNVAQPVKVEFPVNGKPTVFDITDLLRETCLKLIPPIAESLQKLVATFDPEFQQKLRNNVLLGGGGSQLHGLNLAIEEALREYGGGKVTKVEEPMYAGANGALKLAYDMPEEFWEKLV